MRYLLLVGWLAVVTEALDPGLGQQRTERTTWHKDASLSAPMTWKGAPHKSLVLTPKPSSNNAFLADRTTWHKDVSLSAPMTWKGAPHKSLVLTPKPSSNNAFLADRIAVIAMIMLAAMTFSATKSWKRQTRDRVASLMRLAETVGGTNVRAPPMLPAVMTLSAIPDAEHDHADDPGHSLRVRAEEYDVPCVLRSLIGQPMVYVRHAMSFSNMWREATRLKGKDNENDKARAQMLVNRFYDQYAQISELGLCADRAAPHPTSMPLDDEFGAPAGGKLSTVDRMINRAPRSLGGCYDPDEIEEPYYPSAEFDMGHRDAILTVDGIMECVKRRHHLFPNQGAPDNFPKINIDSTSEVRKWMQFRTGDISDPGALFRKWSGRLHSQSASPENIEMVYVSPMRRPIATLLITFGELLVRNPDIPIIPEPLLHEKVFSMADIALDGQAVADFVRKLLKLLLPDGAATPPNFLAFIKSLEELGEWVEKTYVDEFGTEVPYYARDERGSFKKEAKDEATGISRARTFLNKSRALPNVGHTLVVAHNGVGRYLGLLPKQYKGFKNVAGVVGTPLETSAAGSGLWAVEDDKWCDFMQLSEKVESASEAFPWNSGEYKLKGSGLEVSA